MRSLGLGKVESIKMVNQIFRLDISSAKSLVHNSSTWEDRYEVDQALHDEIEALMIEF
ncbi:hypothetical protein GCM10008938_50470 [Deinococcus roseus]|uniref:Uncharacterized protein n=1 Tax=Deinococcus roseus TaxID=392414 RepID=A0ABQ2DKE1_9DEIO|nr:hypothetical protein GCM10008938_50470 [Deinococcus roseus]